ncbi:hypothetical protein [Paraburkholderia aspalathi]|uniref:hypothetical protein n=1 Tax=Paraburkholderia aspalathi TaxID=1324617 RepID=UPI003C9FF8D2
MSPAPSQYGHVREFPLLTFELFRHPFDERQAFVDGGAYDDGRYIWGTSGVLIDSDLSAQ